MTEGRTTLANKGAFMFDIHQTILRDDEADEDRVQEYIEGLSAAFAASPEAQAVYQEHGDQGWTSFMLEYAINHLGVTPPEMTVRDLQEILFDLFPRKVSTEPESAPGIIAELRALWTFLHRQYGLTNAPKILGVLTDGAVRRLQGELANPANYGMAKSMFMLGQRSGFDMTTQEGLDEFMAFYNSRLAGGLPPDLGGAFPLPPFPDLPPSPLSHKEREKKRKQRKAQRQARKRNRK
jgi:hypothetical protein